VLVATAGGIVVVVAAVGAGAGDIGGVVVAIGVVAIGGATTIGGAVVIAAGGLAGTGLGVVCATATPMPADAMVISVKAIFEYIWSLHD
jgi:hypothetical protein